MPDDVLYRAFAGEVEIRSAGDGRTVYGAAVPFDLPARIDSNLVEEWDRAAFEHQMRAIHRVPLFDLHGPHGGVRVGKLSMARADPKHLYVEAHVNDSPQGDDYLDRVSDGERPHFSIGFTRAKTVKRGNVYRRMKADLLEVAGVPQGAFGAAASIAGVRALADAEVGADADVEEAVCATCGHRSVVEQEMSRSMRVAVLVASLPMLDLP
jgi:HK97 family phage prohead protease